VRDTLLVALGGALGSVARWLVARGAHRLLPAAAAHWGTFAVNVTGSFAIGVVATLALQRAQISPAARVFLVTGLLGGYTTFSAFSWETLTLARGGQWPAALAYALGSLAGGVLAAFIGVAIASRAA
jgi:CrcB protein